MATLAWLAEQADGQRNKPLSLVIDTNGEPQLRKGDKPGRVKDGLRYEGKSEDEGTMGPTGSRYCDHTPQGGKKRDAAPRRGFDAVFWTQSSVEKFVWPYYHSHRLWE